MGLKECVLERVKELQGDRSMAKAGNDWGIPQSTLHSWLTQGREPKLDNLERICAVEGIALEWLFTGKKSCDSDYSVIPFIDVEVSAGNGSYVISENEASGFKVSKSWLAIEGLSNKKLVIVKTKGDSMEPTIPDGSNLIIDTERNDCQQEGVYVIRNNNDLLVKRLRFDPFNQQLHIISDNSFYTPIIVAGDKLENVSVIGKVERLAMVMM
ncbi:LexA family transcriptional regulator [Shewanella algae]|uniref:LexA family transcriptional regulator n=1 Tax=Shewanella algae TaxID=38313 RepID=UPI001F401B24|nr:S24 family peptidase [Shewanella algae]MCE9783630.1 hypothetical protein [Shewanella algae]